ncbi:hypothetical protein IPJ72_01745 [Candidatus Peregrinibacteria bacterium]|nr:MAG: hypothetical protein IPJ72_01745 [Candidatus Peregrinibacteria bacterium]
MNDSNTSNIQPPLNIPTETREKFLDLVSMIEKSKSMNPEERQYWVDVLPVMNEDQINNLKSILDNEQKELSAANDQYEKEVGETIQNAKLKFDEFKYLEKKRALREAEKASEAEEQSNEEDLLKALNEL